MITIEPRFLYHGEVNRSALIREAFRHLGVEATNRAVIDYAKKRWDVDVSSNQMSALRNDVKKEQEARRINAVANQPAYAVEVIPATSNGKAPAPPEPPPVEQPLSMLERIRLIRRAIAEAGGKDALKSLIDEL